MGWAALIPLAASVLGSMGKEGEQGQQAPAVPPPPSLGEIFAMNEQGYQQPQNQLPYMQPTSLVKVGGGSHG